jgi:ADP-ribosylation factor-like protein 13B
MNVYDLGGAKNIRRVWRSYLAEVHAVVYVVDAADSGRFEECRKVLHETLEQQHLHQKPILIFANKQDLPTAAPAVEVAKQLGLSELQRNRFHVLACTAKTTPGQLADPRLREGLSWLVSAVDSVYTQLDTRVQQEAEAVRQEELRKKKEREERARLQREERLRQQQQREAEEAAAAAAAGLGTAGIQGPTLAAHPSQGQANGRTSIHVVEPTSHHNFLSALPGSIQSPKPAPDALRISIPPPGASQTSLPLIHPVTAGNDGGPSPDFSDLQAHRADPSSRSLAPRPQSGTQPAEHVVTILSESPGAHTGPLPPLVLSEQPDAQVTAISIEPALTGAGPRSSTDGGASVKRSASLVRGGQNKVAPSVV